MNEQLELLIKEAVSDADLSLGEIPNIALYLDQILSLVSEKNEEGSSCYKEHVLTKTMINNYSKEGAILPLKGKKYNRSQILQILFIYSLKSTLSIGEIKRIFEGVYALDGENEEEFSALWSDFLEIKERCRTETSRICEDVTKGLQLDTEKDEDHIRLVLALVSLSAYLRTLAETMIDVRCPMPLEESSDKAEKAEEKKAKKTEKAEEKKARKTEKAEKKKAEKSERAEEKKAEKKKDTAKSPKEAAE